MKVTAVDRCRLCGGGLEPVLSLGVLALTGRFPRSREEEVPAAPLELARCAGACGLTQLRHTCEAGALFGPGYGYRSGLNPAMARHLSGLAAWALERSRLEPGDVAVDIGSNDGTLLAALPSSSLRVGVDPLADQFAAGYPEGAVRVPELFSAEAARKAAGGRRAKLIAAAAMFYDVERPVEFLRGCRELLADDGLLVVELAYLPAMLERTAYDAVCHEHLAYYGLAQLERAAHEAGLAAVEAELNGANGGSLRAAFRQIAGARPTPSVAALLASEGPLASTAPFDDFRGRVLAHRDALRELVHACRKPLGGYGASTKGNVLLQSCGFTEKDVAMIGEVNADKFGAFTPGSRIPIVPEARARAACRDLLVLPWHHRDFIIEKEAEFLRAGGRLLFPLPEPELVVRRST